MKNLYAILLLTITFLFIIPIVKAPCCLKGCFPDMNCCVTVSDDPLCVKPSSDQLCGTGVVGCSAKINNKLQYLCLGDALTPGNCGTCTCSSQYDCKWLAKNDLCPPTDFCSISYDGNLALSSSCLQRCPEGTKLCGDNTCKQDCTKAQSPEPICDGNCNNGKGDSCACPECLNKQASCQSALVCDKYTNLCIGKAPCPERTTICLDGFCRQNCFFNNGPGYTPDNNDNTCNGANEPNEGCTVKACISETLPCDIGLFCKNGLCQKIPAGCPSCTDCYKGIGNPCNLDECHNCDLSKCYYYEGLLGGGRCAECPATACSDYKKDSLACNAKIKGCEKNCYWTGEKCEVCTAIKKCQDYTVSETCIADPCKTGVCAWKNNQCIPSPKSDPDDTPENCEAYDASQKQEICDTSGETNCWDEKATDIKVQIKCCGDDKALDTWRNSDGSGCVEGAYFRKGDDSQKLCGFECTDKAISCWSSTVYEEYEDSELTRCCELNEQWSYSTGNRLADVLVKESCIKTEWYKITRQDTVTYFELYR